MHTNLSVIIWTSVWLFSFIQPKIQISTYLIIEIYIINSIYIFSLKLTLISLQHQIIQKFVSFSTMIIYFYVKITSRDSEDS